MREGSRLLIVLLCVGAASPVGAAPSIKPPCDETSCGMNGPQRTGLRAEVRVANEAVISVTLPSAATSDVSSSARTPPYRPTCVGPECGGPKLTDSIVLLSGTGNFVNAAPPPPIKPPCDEFGCGMNGPWLTGLGVGAAVTSTSVSSVTLLSGRTLNHDSDAAPPPPIKPPCDEMACGANGPWLTGLGVAITNRSVSSVTLPSGGTANHDNDAAPPPPGKPVCDDWGCGMNGPWLTGLAVRAATTNALVSSVTLPSGETTNGGTAAGPTGKPVCDEWGCGMNGPLWTGLRAKTMNAKLEVSAVTLRTGKAMQLAPSAGR